jgi:hypothetical protein
MKCLSCDVILTDREDARKYVASEEHIGLCDNCFSYVETEIDYIGDSPKPLIEVQPMEEE